MKCEFEFILQWWREFPFHMGQQLNISKNAEV